MKTSRLLIVVLVLQGMILAGQWLGAPQVIGTAQAQQMDPARDRVQMLEELRAVNGKLDRLIDLLGSGNLQVKVNAPDDNRGRSAGR
jgi:hypothetical protein